MGVIGMVVRGGVRVGSRAVRATAAADICRGYLWMMIFDRWRSSLHGPKLFKVTTMISRFLHSLYGHVEGLLRGKGIGTMLAVVAG